jgi:hypothetical protein
MITASARALLTQLIDYAGLFPPAGLGMAEAVAEHSRQRLGPEAWMLGRFVVPAARLDEFEEAMLSDRVPSAGAERKPGAPWSLSALVGPAFTTHADEIVAFNARHGDRARVDSVEFRAASRAELEAALDTIPGGLGIFVELPLDRSLDELLAVVRGRAANAKVRTGGIESSVIPPVPPLARFLEACASARVPFKATAGLHHPLRAEYPLTYEADSPRATLHGFLNVFAAAVFARGGMPAAELEALLRETRPEELRLDDAGLGWRDRSVSADELALARRDFALSFGSCSFGEPVAELKALGVIG